MSRSYAALRRQPVMVRAGLPSVLARLPLGMTPLTLLLLVQHVTGSFAMAGATMGMFALTSALSGPIRGRAVDRLGARPILLATGILQPVTLVALAIGATRIPFEVGWVLLAAGTAGTLLPPVGPVVRVLWQGLSTAELRNSALAVDSVVVQLVYFAAGPPLVAAILVWGSPVAPILVVAGLTLVGTVGVATAPALDEWPRYAPAGSGGALVTPGLIPVLMLVVLTAAAIGALEVAVTGFAAEQQHISMSGLLLGVFGAGSVVGGLVYGARSRLPSPGGYSRALATLTAGLALPVLAPDIGWLAGLLLLAGVAASSSNIVQFVTIGHLAPRPVLTEAFTWLLSASQAGTAAGAALTGAAVQSVGSRWALSLPVVLAAAAWWLCVSFGARLRLGR